MGRPARLGWPRVLGGADQPRDAAESWNSPTSPTTRLEFAGAARLFDLAFRIEPRLADDLNQAHRYNAACCAALAAAGRAGASPLTASADRRSEAEALRWLRVDLAARSDCPATPRPSEKAQLLQALGHWKVDTELAGVRDAGALAGSPSPNAGPGWLSGGRSTPSSVRSSRASNRARPGAGSGFPDA